MLVLSHTPRSGKGNERSGATRLFGYTLRAVLCVGARFKNSCSLFDHSERKKIIIGILAYPVENTHTHTSIGFQMVVVDHVGLLPNEKSIFEIGDLITSVDAINFSKKEATMQAMSAINSFKDDVLVKYVRSLSCFN